MSKISVIVPVYKVEPYLHRCVDSILTQSFTDFELILVDDGSPDRCGKICDEYVKKDSRVHVIHQENMGLSSARNAGIDWAFENSDSEWISFVDSDDWVSPSFFSQLYNAVNQTNTEISVCQFHKTSDYELLEINDIKVSILKWEEFYIRDTATAVIACNKLYAKQLFKNYRYPVGRIHEDEFLTYLLLYSASEIAFVAAPLYYYFYNSLGIMHSSFTLKHTDAIDAFEEQINFAKKHCGKDYYYNRLFSKLRYTSDFLLNMEESKIEKTTAWKRIKRKLLVKQKVSLLLHGKEIAPVKQYRYYYDQAFPLMSWIYWTGKAIKRKLEDIIR